MKPWLGTALLGIGLAGCGGTAREAAFSGYAEADLVYVAASAAGTLQTLAVQRGQPVRAGQPLFALDADAEALTREGAAARSERASAQAADLRKGRRPDEIAAIDQQLAQAQATLVASTSSLQRNQKLVEQGFIAPLQLEGLVAARDRDAARLRELQAQRRMAVEAARTDEIAAAAAEARGAQADLALARWREGQKARSAPADALVYDVMYRIGEWVPAGAPVLALLPPAALKLRFYVPEILLSRVKVGDPIQVACDGCATGLSARISYVSPQAEYTPPVIYSNESRGKLVFLVEARPDAGTALKPGQPVDVRLAAVP